MSNEKETTIVKFTGAATNHDKVMEPSQERIAEILLKDTQYQAIHTAVINSMGIALRDIDLQNTDKKAVGDLLEEAMLSKGGLSKALAAYSEELWFDNQNSSEMVAFLRVKAEEVMDTYEDLDQLPMALPGAIASALIIRLDEIISTHEQMTQTIKQDQDGGPQGGTTV